MSLIVLHKYSTAYSSFFLSLDLCFSCFLAIEFCVNHLKFYFKYFYTLLALWIVLNCFFSEKGCHFFINKSSINFFPATGNLFIHLPVLNWDEVARNQKVFVHSFGFSYTYCPFLCYFYIIELMNQKNGKFLLNIVEVVLGKYFLFQKFCFVIFFCRRKIMLENRFCDLKANSIVLLEDHFKNQNPSFFLYIGRRCQYIRKNLQITEWKYILKIKGSIKK